MDVRENEQLDKPRITFVSIESPFLLPQEASKFLRIHLRTLNNHRLNKTGPSYRKHGGKICYHKDDLVKWSRRHTEKA